REKSRWRALGRELVRRWRARPNCVSPFPFHHAPAAPAEVPRAGIGGLSRPRRRVWWAAENDRERLPRDDRLRSGGAGFSFFSRQICPLQSAREKGGMARSTTWLRGWSSLA